MTVATIDRTTLADLPAEERFLEAQNQIDKNDARNEELRVIRALLERLVHIAEKGQR